MVGRLGKRTYFMMDHPEEMKALAQIHEDKALALLEKMVDNADTPVFISLDKPGLRLLCAISVSRQALMRLVGACGVDCLEGITPPPMGDVPLWQARAMTGYANFTVNGGMDTSHLEIRDNAEQEINRYVRQLFESMGDKRHFIFESSCTTPLATPWENLVCFRDAAREYGALAY